MKSPLLHTQRKTRSRFVDVDGLEISQAPERAQFTYTFDHLADVIDRFTTVATAANRAALLKQDFARVAASGPQTDLVPERSALRAAR